MRNGRCEKCLPHCHHRTKLKLCCAIQSEEMVLFTQNLPEPSCVEEEGLWGWGRTTTPKVFRRMAGGMAVACLLFLLPFHTVLMPASNAHRQEGRKN